MSEQTALQLVNEQAEDEGLWFIARTAPEAYLQQELRRLHAAVEAEARAEIDAHQLAKAIWNRISTLSHAEHELGECSTCDTHRSIVFEVVRDDARLIAAEYARLQEQKRSGSGFRATVEDEYRDD